MLRRRLAIAALICGSLVSSAVPAVGQGRAEQPPRMRLDPPLLVIPSGPLSEAVHHAEAIVLVRVNRRLGTRVVDRRTEVEHPADNVVLPYPIPEPFTEYDVAPLEVIKPDVPFAFGTVMRVASFGGAGEFNGTIVERPSHTAELIEGRTYLLFLRRWESQDLMLFHTFDVFDFSGPRVEAGERLRSTPHGKELVGLTPERALWTIKQMLAGAPR